MPDLRLQLQSSDDPDVAPLSPAHLPEPEALDLLFTADFMAQKLVPWGSNYTFAVGLTSCDGRDFLGIYKPQAGEQPLWDFPGGTLYRREYASYRLSQWMGWDIVPPTVIRDGPHGIGSVQLYIEPTSEPVDEQEFWGRQIPEIERIVMFDHIANNADRKIGHCLLAADGKIWGIDHGLTFNFEAKLRTVLWQYCGEPISSDIQADLERLLDEGDTLLAELREVLSGPEVTALKRRVRGLLDAARYPDLDPYANVPRGWW